MSRHVDHPPQQQVSVLGIVALVIGCAGFAIGLIPCVGLIFGTPVSAIATVLALIAVLMSATNKRTGLALPLVALIISGLALAAPFVLTGLYINAGANAVESEQEKQKRKDREAQRLLDEDKKVREESGIKVSAIELIKAYKGKKDEAETKYGDKVLEVEGEVKSVSKDGKSVTLKGEGEQESVDCGMMDDQKSEALKLKPGDKAVIRGMGEGSSVDGSNAKLRQSLVVK